MGDEPGILDRPRGWITDDRDKVKGTPHSIRDVGNAIKEGAKDTYDMGMSLLSNKEKADLRYGKK